VTEEKILSFLVEGSTSNGSFKIKISSHLVWSFSIDED
jgi:hypothetical protein